MGLFTSFEMPILLAQTALAVNTFLWPVYFLPLFYQFARNDDALTAGKRKLLRIIAVIAGLLFSGALYRRWRVVGPWFTTGTSLVFLVQDS